MMIKGSNRFRHRPIGFRPLRETIQKLPKTQTNPPASTRKHEPTTKHIGYIPSVPRKVLQLKVTQGAEAVPPQ